MILAVESATPRGSVALASGGAVRAERFLPPGRQASEAYIAAVEELFSEAGARPGDVSCVAVSAGPGSFTGLRVGMSAAKGFCFGWGVPLALVPTLSGLASRIPGEGRSVCPVLDARKKEVYAALFRRVGEGVERLSPDMAISPEALLDRLPAGDVVFCGDGMERYGVLFRDRLGDRMSIVSGPDGLPAAGAVGIAGERAFLAGKVADPRSAVPAYIRTPEAEFRRMGNPPAGSGTVS
ncbi:MAG: tRNA (adenosine(37)-N6)-threonylcarbamoyltransferase complex dimerization subunit type 1 TsaB [Deltaproteobacteria bacterium]|nr:tRNA (adenosine(37)-N6)-threonylcarbamoyltransferase complex dimerization subunit type 1 TsaB [Deltaproteobacteria bacterium]